MQIAALGAASAVIGVAELSGEGLVAAFVDRLGVTRAIFIGLVVNSLAALSLPWMGRTELGAVAGLLIFYLSFEFALVSVYPLMTEVALRPGNHHGAQHDCPGTRALTGCLCWSAPGCLV